MQARDNRRQKRQRAATQSKISRRVVMINRSALWMFFLVLSLAALVWAAGPGYHVVNTYKLGGDGGWDYLTADSDARRLYISRGTHVMVIDLDSGKSVG